MFSNKKSAPPPVGASGSLLSTPPNGVIGTGAVHTPRPAPVRTGERGAPSVIGPDLTIVGNLLSVGEVQLDGEVQGDLHATHVVVGEHARVTGGIVAEEVIVRGHVMGSIHSKKVMLQSSSHVEGDIFHQTLSIEQGAFFEGKSRRSEDPTAGMARPEAGHANGTGYGNAIPLPGSK